MEVHCPHIYMTYALHTQDYECLYTLELPRLSFWRLPFHPRPGACWEGAGLWAWGEQNGIET